MGWTLQWLPATCRVPPIVHCSQERYGMGSMEIEEFEASWKKSVLKVFRLVR